MPRSSQIQTSFSGGELSPRLHGRVDADLYRRALETCLNWEPTPQGPILLRGGSIFQASLPLDPSVRLVPMRMSDEQDFVLVFGGGQARFFSVDRGQFEVVRGVDLVVNGDFGEGDSNWTIRAVPGSGSDANGDARIDLSVCTFTAPDPAPPPAVIPPVMVYSKQLRQGATLPRDVTGKVRVRVKSISGGEVRSGASAGYKAVTLRALLETGDGSPGGLVARVDYDRASPDGTIWDVPFTGVAGPLNLNLYLVSKDGTVNVSITPCTCVIDDVSLVMVDEEGFEITIPWSDAQLSELQYDAESGRNRMVFAHPDVEPWFLQYNATWDYWTFQKVPFAEQPEEWGAENWPSTVTFFQGRLWLAATPKQRNDVWGSRSGRAFDFTPETPVPGGDPVQKASDRVTAPLSTRGAVRWMRGRQMLLIGTDLGEHAMTGSSGLITPIDLQVREESGFGSAAVQAIDLGSVIAYVSRDRRKVRILDFSNEAQSYQSRDLTFVAEHITKAGIAEVHHAKDPSGTVVVVLDDGKLACCTFDRAEQLSAWWRAELPGGKVLSAAVSNGPYGSLLYMAVQRSTGIHLEMIPMSDTHPSRVYLDAAVIRTYSVPEAEAASIPYVEAAPSSWDIGQTFDLTNGNGAFVFHYMASMVGVDVVFHAGGRLRIAAVSNPYVATVRIVEALDATVIAGLTSGGAAHGGDDWHFELAGVDGLGTLEGMQVGGVVDGSLLPPATVSTGAVEIAPPVVAVPGAPGAPVHRVIVGVPYTARGVTLRPEGGNPAGTAQGAKRRRPKIVVRLNDSAVPRVNGKRAAERNPTTGMDAAEGGHTGDVAVWDVGWDEEGRVTIEQDLPLRTEVLAVFGPVQLNEV